MKKILISLLSMCFVVGALSSCTLFQIPGSTSSDSGVLTESSSDDLQDSSSSEDEKKEYCTVTFKQDNQADVVKQVEKGSDLTDIPAPKTRTGYTVVWGEATLTNITENLVVKAVETPNKYTITYDAQGGTVANATQEVTYDAETTLATPTREDYSFNGWTYNGNAVVSDAKWTIADDVTLTASWIDARPTYTVTFVDGTNVKPVSVKKGESVATADIPTFVGKVGYAVAWDKTDYTNIQADLTVTAVYTANTYTVTYEADDFAIDGTTAVLTYDAVCSVLDMSLTKEDANFLGWKYGDVTYTNVSVWNVAEDVTLTAEWADKDQVTVSFIDTDGSTINKTFYKGADLTDIPTPKAKTGYTVDTENWYADVACTQVATFTGVQESVTVYAKATANTYTITYDVNGGLMENATQSVTYGATYTLATPTHDTAYMQFDGWKDAQGNIIVAGTWTTANDVTLTAVWTDTRETFTVSFVQENQETKTFSVKAGESLTEIPTPAAKTGYDVAWDMTDFTNITKDLTVMAVETAKTYTITLNANGGTSATTLTVTYGETYALPTPTRSGMTFQGWYYNGAIIPSTGTWTNDGSDITLVAEWKDEEWTKNY